MTSLQCPLILVERDIRNLLPTLAERVGYLPTGREAHERVGLQVWAAMEEFTSTSGYPTNYCFSGYHDGWTVIGDEAGLLVSQPSLWRKVAQTTGAQVLLLFVDPELDAYGFRLFAHDGRSRAVLRAAGDLDLRGGPCAAEAGLTLEQLNASSLLEIAHRIGANLEAINHGAHFCVREFVSPGVSWEDTQGEQNRGWAVRDGATSPQPSL